MQTLGLMSLIGAAFVFSAVLSLSLRIPNQPRADLALPLGASDLTPYLANGTSNALRYDCNGNHFGRGLSVGSCSNVFDYIIKSDLQNTFSERHTGRVSDIPLPWRVMSDDGRCFVQPFLSPGVVSGHASSSQMGLAAWAVLQKCVVEQGIGGVVAGIGGDNNVRVAVAGFAPTVRCDRSGVQGPPWESCLKIVMDMKANKTRQVFGHASDPRVQVKLPVEFKASEGFLLSGMRQQLTLLVDARCAVLVDIKGKSTSVAWYEIWEAVIAVATMCVRAAGKGGKYHGLGFRKNIFLNMMDDNPDGDRLDGNATVLPSVGAFQDILAQRVPLKMNWSESMANVV